MQEKNNFLRLMNTFKNLFNEDLFNILNKNEFNVSKLNYKELYVLNYLLNSHLSLFKEKAKTLFLGLILPLRSLVYLKALPEIKELNQNCAEPLNNRVTLDKEELISLRELLIKIDKENILISMRQLYYDQFIKIFPYDTPKFNKPINYDSLEISNHNILDWISLFKYLLNLHLITNGKIKFIFFSDPNVFNLGVDYFNNALKYQYMERARKNPLIESGSHIKLELKNNKDLTLKNTFNSEISPKKIQLRLKNRVLVHEPKDWLLLAKFSDSQINKNKNIQNKILINQYFGSDIHKEPGFISRLETEKNLNIRQNLSVIASIISTKQSTSKAVLDLFFNNSDLEPKIKISEQNQILDSNPLTQLDLDPNISVINQIIDSYKLTQLDKLKIKNIFIIHADEFNLLNPQFYFRTNVSLNLLNTVMQTTKINLIKINLVDFCLLFATLYHEQNKSSIKKIKANLKLNEGINLNEDLTIESDQIIGYLSSFIDYKNSIFIFNQINWSDVLQKFYEFGIDISGGSTVKRHLISPMDYILSNFINIFSREGYQDSVITTHLLADSIYKPNKSKSVKNIYQKDLLKNKILSHLEKINLNNFNQINGFIFNDAFDKLDNIQEFKYLYSNYILNYWIFRFDTNNTQKDLISNEINSFYKNFDYLLSQNISELQSSENFQNNIINKKEKNLLKLNQYVQELKNIGKRNYTTLIGNRVIKYNSNLSFSHSRGRGVFKHYPNNTLYTTKRFSYSLFKTNLFRNFSSGLNFSTINNLPFQILEESNLKNNTNDFYLHIKNIINNSNLDSRLIQKKIEENWIETIFDNLDNDHVTLRSHGKIYYLKALDSFNTVQFQKDLKSLVGKDLLYLYQKPIFVFLTLALISDGYETKSHTMLGSITGFNIIKHIYVKNKIYDLDIKFKLFNLILANHKLINFKGKFKNKKDFLNFKPILEKTEKDLLVDTNDFNTRLGLIFINLYLGEYVKLFKLDYKITKNNRLFAEKDRPLHLTLTETSSEEFKTFRDDFIIQPKNIPMVCPPLLWDKDKYGGFLINEQIQEDVILGSIAYHNHSLTGEGKIKLFKTINYLNKIKFGINKSLLYYLINEGSYLFNIMGPEEVFNSKISIKLAEIYKNIPFYITTHADWRGRIYTHSFYLSYQGSEIANALLQFWEGFSLNDTGKFYLYANGACSYSSELNKSTMNERVKWVENNRENILNMKPEFMLKADSPLLFAAFCLEMQKLNKDPKVKIHLPIYIDATCSGIQHLSAMFLDNEIAKLVNLISEDSNSKPKDIYQELVDPINLAINMEGKLNKDFSALEFLCLTRKELKTPIMTQNYNVSIFGMKEQLFNSLKVLDTSVSQELKGKKYKIIGQSKFGEDIELSHKDLLKIAMIIKTVIYTEFPLLKEIYDYFIKLALLMETLNLSFSWITPTGAIITQEYKKTEEKKLRLNLDKKTKVKIIRTVIPAIDHPKQKGGIIPNVIHSLDSSHIINLICEIPLEIESPVVTVHDCFGSHPNYIEVLNYRLKEEFVSLYVNNKFIKLFQKRIIQHIKDNNYLIIKEKKNTYVILPNKEKLLIPKPPIKYTLDLNKILDSKYMFN